MKKQKAKMFFRDIMQESKPKPECKQFKTCTGSPILYTRLKKHRGIYYPLAKHHPNMKPKPKQNPKHICVVYSRTYGREMYGNIDIWPDNEQANERLLQKLQAMSAEEDEDDDVGIDIPKAIEDMSDNKTSDKSTENGTRTKPPNDTRHVTIVVTDTSEETSPSSDETQLHPVQERPESPPETEGTWPLKRSQSIDSRDNPFLPGGNLSKEADEILSKATIIRDTFILQDDGSVIKSQQSPTTTNHPSSPSSQPSGDHSNGNNCISQTPVSDSMTQNEVVKVESAVVQNASPSPTKTRPKENGQVDSENSVTPGSVTVELADDNKDKKKQKKCCAVM